MAQKKKTGGDITLQIIQQFKDRSRAQIDRWRQALDAANAIESPQTHLLQDLYDNLEADGHLTAQTRLRKAATTGCGFSIVNRKTGKADIEKTELFNAEWFYNWMDDALDSVFKGYTVMELTDPDTMEFALIPRRNLIGRKDFVLLEAGQDRGIDISAGYENRLVAVGKKTDFGIMQHLCGLLIWKRNAQQSWAEFTERFGMPLISATTSKTSPADVKKLDAMLAALGESARAVLPEGTTVKIDPFTGGDSYRVFDAQIERINEEMSKPIVGGSMITDDGSSRSQSEVHERNLDDKLAETDRRMIQFTVNNQIIPIMRHWGWNVNPESDKFLFDTSFELSLGEHWNIVDRVWERAEIPAEWISKTFNVPIEKMRETPLMPAGGREGMAANFR
ncbi:MAG: DUF935 domain-containing protein [Bacteroidales bacterium]|jgi:phage gp29-like protein|nr:DUF935 domain-containing protein [Bacteroidales bacterium]